MNKFTASLSVLATTAIIAFSGSTAIAATPTGPTAEWCKSRHHTNVGQCKKDWNNWLKNHSKLPKVPKHNMPSTGGSGYGSASSNVSLTLNNSNNNIIQVVINQVINIFR